MARFVGGKGCFMPINSDMEVAKYSMRVVSLSVIKVNRTSLLADSLGRLGE